MKRKLLILFAALSGGITLNAQIIFNVKTPAALAGNCDISVATDGWGTPDLNIASNAIENQLVFVGPDSLACTAPTNTAQLTGKIAVLYRGTCEFGAKAKAAQTAGAIGVVIINNQGAPIAMGAGAAGLDVTVPVVMISTFDGARLRDQIIAGNVRAFIGTKSGLFPNDLGFNKEQVVYAKMGSRPLQWSGNANDFVVEPALWVHNYGSNAQTGVTVSATITRYGTTVYSDSETGITIPAGDSVAVEFDNYGPAYTATGDYELTYTIASGATDDDPFDNQKKSHYSITTGAIAYGQTDAATKLPVVSTFTRSSTAAPNYYCMAFRDPKASGTVTGLSFATSPLGTYDMTDEYIELELYAWDDAFADINDDPTFDNLNLIAFAEYTYASNSENGKTVYAPTEDFATLVPNQRYLACLKMTNDSIQVGFYNEVDYAQNLNEYLEPISPTKGGATWYSGGFGTSITTSIGVHIADPLGVSENKANSEFGIPYPAPASQYVNIPFKGKDVASATVAVTDLNGRLVETVEATVINGNLRVNTTTLSAGSYLFNVSLANGTTSAFKVIIAR
ncbi:MAG: PA domain-containing protein [Bacteroidota bacterium]